MSFDEIEICNEITGNLKYILELEKQFKDKVDSVKEEILKWLKTLWELESIFHYSHY